MMMRVRMNSVSSLSFGVWCIWSAFSAPSFWATPLAMALGVACVRTNSL